jgi:hypothetical protein
MTKAQPGISSHLVRRNEEWQLCRLTDKHRLMSPTIY